MPRSNELTTKIGVPPKRLARILRFRQSLRRLARAPSLELRQIALECGYYDQPHFYRDFRELALMTPTQYLLARGDGLDGDDVVIG